MSINAGRDRFNFNGDGDAGRDKAATAEPSALHLDSYSKPPVKPETAAAKPETAGAKPDAAASKPDAPVKPETAAAKPDAVAKPETASTKPEAIAAKPTAIAAKPESESIKADAPKAKSEAGAVAAKPEGVPSKPETAASPAKVDAAPANAEKTFTADPYKVQANDSLWSISANRLKQDGEVSTPTAVLKELHRLQKLNSAEHPSLKKKPQFLRDNWDLKIYDDKVQPKAAAEPKSPVEAKPSLESTKPADASKPAAVDAAKPEVKAAETAAPRTGDQPFKGKAAEAKPEEKPEDDETGSARSNRRRKDRDNRHGDKRERETRHARDAKAHDAAAKSKDPEQKPHDKATPAKAELPKATAKEAPPAKAAPEQTGADKPTVKPAPKAPEAKPEATVKPVDHPAKAREAKPEATVKPVEQPAKASEAKPETTAKPAEQPAKASEAKPEATVKPVEQPAKAPEAKPETTAKPAEQPAKPQELSASVKPTDAPTKSAEPKPVAAEAPKSGLEKDKPLVPAVPYFDGLPPGMRFGLPEDVSKVPQYQGPMEIKPFYMNDPTMKQFLEGQKPAAPKPRADNATDDPPTQPDMTYRSWPLKWIPFLPVPKEHSSEHDPQFRMQPVQDKTILAQVPDATFIGEKGQIRTMIGKKPTVLDDQEFWLSKPVAKAFIEAQDQVKAAGKDLTLVDMNSAGRLAAQQEAIRVAHSARVFAKHHSEHEDGRSIDIHESGYDDPKVRDILLHNGFVYGNSRGGNHMIPNDPAHFTYRQDVYNMYHGGPHVDLSPPAHHGRGHARVTRRHHR